MNEVSLTGEAAETQFHEEPQDARQDMDAATAAPVDELALARELVLQAHPQVVPEMIEGATLAEMLASVPAARAAWERIAAAAREGSQPVPAGGQVRSARINPEHLSAMAKIRAGLRPA